MDNNSCIFWFSGTGNSLYAAKRLSTELSNIPLAQIAEETQIDAVGDDGAKIGFVFPSYYGNLPRAVRRFVEKLDIRPGTYIYAIVTMGGAGQGSVAALGSALKAKGLWLNYGRGIHMPANYVAMYNPADMNKCGNVLDRADSRLKKIAADIKAEKQSVKKLPITANNLYKNIETLDSEFVTNNMCTGCGLCERICPVRNIGLSDGKPKWLHRCERCMACISWCPSKAINYGSRTQSRRRYQNPRIDVKELVDRKE